jgi:hypothetical protein
MVLSPEHSMNRNAGMISTLGKIWEEIYFCLCYAGFKSRTGREYNAEIHHRPQLLIRIGELRDQTKNDRPKAAISDCANCIA